MMTGICIPIMVEEGWTKQNRIGQVFLTYWGEVRDTQQFDWYSLYFFYMLENFRNKKFL